MVANIGIVSTSFVDSFKAVIPQAKTVLSFQEIPSLDLLIFTGGSDISPVWYGREEISNSHGIDVIRDAKEIASLTLALKYPDIKILGVCRGHQLVNAYLGGELIEDLSEVTDTHGIGKHGAYHELEIVDNNSIIATYFNLVNSMHHQAVISPGKGQRVTSKVGDIIESTESDRILTVQFHPEWMTDSDNFWQYISNEWLLT